MSKLTAHNLEARPRTADVFVEENLTFRSMDVLDTTLEGLHLSGFRKPSPIQHRAIPLGLCGYDLIVQAKSGTGKTVVFGVVALEVVQVTTKKCPLQVLILAPTREIAIQIHGVMIAIGQCLEGLHTECFIGGTQIDEDRKKLQGCHIAVGTPGRVKHLVEKKVLNTENIRLFILDEADKLTEASFLKDINFIYSLLPAKKQMIASSATYGNELDCFLARYMKNPSRVSPKQEAPVLIGIKQYVTILKQGDTFEDQLNIQFVELKRLFTSVPFKQCLVFTNKKTSAESLSVMLHRNNWPAEYITGSHDQAMRQESMAKLKEFKTRVLLTTDLTARGVDVENVNLVVSLDVPYNGSTYLHRIGRAGRYGSHGIAITMASGTAELNKLKFILGEIAGSAMSVKLIPEGKIPDLWDFDNESMDKLYGIDIKYGNELMEKCEDKENIPFSNGGINNAKNEISKDINHKITSTDIMVDNVNQELQSMKELEDVLSNADKTEEKNDTYNKNISLLSVTQLMVDTEKTNLDKSTDEATESINVDGPSMMPVENIDDLISSLSNFQTNFPNMLQEEKGIITQSRITPLVENDVKYLLKVNKSASSVQSISEKSETEIDGKASQKRFRKNKTKAVPNGLDDQEFVEKLRAATATDVVSHNTTIMEMKTTPIKKDEARSSESEDEQIDDEETYIQKLKTKVFKTKLEDEEKSDVNLAANISSKLSEKRKLLAKAQLDDDRAFLNNLKSATMIVKSVQKAQSPTKNKEIKEVISSDSAESKKVLVNGKLVDICNVDMNYLINSSDKELQQYLDKLTVEGKERELSAKEVEMIGADKHITEVANETVLNIPNMIPTKIDFSAQIQASESTENTTEVDCGIAGESNEEGNKSSEVVVTNKPEQKGEGIETVTESSYKKVTTRAVIHNEVFENNSFMSPCISPQNNNFISKKDLKSATVTKKLWHNRDICNTDNKTLHKTYNANNDNEDNTDSDEEDEEEVFENEMISGVRNSNLNNYDYEYQWYSNKWSNQWMRQIWQVQNFVQQNAYYRNMHA